MGGANQRRKLFLREPSLLSKFVDFARYLVVCAGLLKRRHPLRLASVESLVQDIDSVGCFSIFFFHNGSSQVCLRQSAANCALRFKASSISLGGTARSLTIPCETTTASLPWKK